MDWRMDGYVKCPACGEENDGAALFGDSSEEGPFGIFDELESVLEEPCPCGARLRIRIEVVT